MSTPNLPGNLTTASILDAHAAMKRRRATIAANKKAEARRLAAAARRSERAAQADAIAMSESLTVTEHKR